ncbi:MAG: hypothetical protein KF729_10970, partial [Sandaracinaceae bacterium]|nr:hypothetical protein [Sandaracinaceae bacterium]
MLSTSRGLGAVALVLCALTASPVAAQRVAVEPFEGPGASAAGASVRRALEARVTVVDATDDPDGTVRGTVRGRGARAALALALVDRDGAQRASAEARPVTGARGR